MRRGVALLAGLAFLLPGSASPARALTDGCVAVGTGVEQVGPFTPAWCSFTATGPTIYAVATTNPYVITVERGGAIVVTVSRPCPGPATTGTIPTTRWPDRVTVSISPWDYARGEWVPNLPGCKTGPSPGIRTGVIVARSEI